MCGIAGFEATDQGLATAQSLTASLGDRGPDGAWWEERANYWLVQTRLAVIDLSPRVVYPMKNESLDLSLLFNGEIYGHGTLRTALQERGHSFRTACDAEVVIHAYEEWGVGAFSRLNGMFALAILDQKTGDLIITRDRFGIKPLVHTTAGPFAFASDALALVAANLSTGEIDRSAVAEFVEFHYLPCQRTGLRDVCSLPPGTALIRHSDGSQDLVEWAGPTFREGEDEDGSPDLDELDAALSVAVGRQLVADVDVGVFLSSGIDSTLLLHYAVSLGARPVAFTVGFAGFGDYDERRRAAQTALSQGVDHHVEEFQIGFHEALELVTGAFDVPFGDASALPTLLLAKLARSSVTVALSGTGADELFAGYYRHRAHRVRVLTEALPASAVSALSRLGVTDSAERSSRINLARSYFARLATAASTDDVAQYMSLTGHATSSVGLSMLSLDFDLERARGNVAEGLSLNVNECATTLDAVQEFDLRTYLPGDVLAKEDRASMRFSLEARVPYLDDAVVKVARRFRPADRTSVAVGKRPLRRLASRNLGGGGLPRQKRGFAVPLGQLFAGPWRSESKEWFHGIESDLLDGDSVGAAIDHGALGAVELWALAALAGWEARLSAARRSPK